MKNENVNAVRQILMNELGLTREAVRGIVDDIVRDAVDKHVRSLLTSGAIEKIVQSRVEIAMREVSYSVPHLRELIAGKVAETVRAHMMRSLPELVIQVPAREAGEGGAGK